MNVCVRRRLVVVLVPITMAMGCASPPSIPRDLPEGQPVSYPFPESAVPESIRVRSPKDARGVDHCSLLTDAELSALGMAPGTGRPGAQSVEVASCDWDRTDDPGNLAGFTTRVDTAEPALRGVYIRGDTTSAEFVPTEVSGHPAVAVRLTPSAGCTMEVGIADDQLLSADANAVGRPMSDDCEQARRIAEVVLSHLPPRTR